MPELNRSQIAALNRARKVQDRLNRALGDVERLASERDAMVRSALTLGLSQTRIASELGVTRPVIYKIIRSGERQG